MSYARADYVQSDVIEVNPLQQQIERFGVKQAVHIQV